MKVYVDMDGVIADFFGEAIKMAEFPVGEWNNIDQREVRSILNSIKGTEFFYNLAKFPTTNTLLQSVINIAGSFSILSSPIGGDEENCKNMKLKWLEDNIPFDIDEVIITHDKPKYAQGNILIDDYGVNVRRWEAAGGYGIKYQADENSLSDVIIPLAALYKKQPF